MAEVTEADLVRTATNFLMSAPPGEFLEVVTDVRALLPRESMLNESAADTFRRYNEGQLIQVSAADGHKIIICKEAKVGENEYFDPAANAVVSFDHIKQEVVSTRPVGGELDAEMEPLRAALDRAASQYVTEQFQFGTSGAYSSRADGCVYVVVSAARFNPTNFWNGRWRAVWAVPFAKSGNANVTGRVRVQVHYYESGNVQLQTEFNKKLAVPASGDVTTYATNAIKAISKTEQAMEAALDNSYATMGDNTFKALRRALPISHQKINWTLIRSYRLGSDITGAPAQ